MNEHVGDIDIARFHTGHLDRARIEAIGAHVRDCPSCAARVWGSRETRDSAAALVRNATAEIKPWLGWVAAAAVLAIIAGIATYAVWRSRRAPAPIPQIVKRPVSRPPAHPWDALVASALQSGTIEPPESLRALRRGAPEIVRGNGHDPQNVRLLDPVGVAVESQTPRFRWTANGGVYGVTVVRNGEVVAKSGPITTTSWTPPRPLPRNAEYEWQLTVEKDGERIRVPGAEEHARFRVVDEDAARLLAAARASGDPIAAGIVAAHAGVIDEALEHLGRASDPRAHALAEKIRRW